MVKKIFKAGEAVLRQKSKEIRKIDKRVLSLIRDLKDTLAQQKDPEGVGLAAPQIGKSLKLFVVSYKNVVKTVLNPEVLEIKEEEESKSSKEKKAKEKVIMEGCLSLPNYYGHIKRHRWVKIRYVDEKGAEKVEGFKGFLAQIILHEIDHLQGILFVDRLIEQKKTLFKLNGDKWEEVELV